MKMLNDSEYGHVICQWFKNEFPALADTSSKDLLELLTKLIISTKENRYGPVPDPEQLVVIRKTIADSIALGHPIPILTGWGGRKANVVTSIDAAEVFALSQILKLNDAIKKFYSPGIMVNIRIEDTGAYWLFRRDPNSALAIPRYSEDFDRLIRIMSPDGVIRGVKESSMMDSKKHDQLAAMYSDLLETVITHQIAYPDAEIEDLDAFRELDHLGWKGTISAEQRNYYIDRYRTLYPDYSDQMYGRMLAEYFAGSKTRYDLDGRGDPKTPVGSFIHLTFVPPVPGAPVSMFSNAAYWRTLPASQGRTHIPAWRAKGYFRIGEEAVGKITSFNDPIVKEMITSTTTLVGLHDSIDIDTDYIIE